ncbi:MAG: MarR family transcriptional regulator [Clostridia bacterium]|nr:MarR family transcriptional regulator [Clostridia bacterium]
MEFEQLLLKITEIFHESLNSFQDTISNDSGFSDITVSQYYYIEAIYRLENPTLTQLAEELKISKASVTAAIDKLIKVGYVSKVQSNEDRRVYHVSLSKKGKRIIENDRKNHLKFAGDIKMCLNEQEIEQFKNIANKIIEQYDKKE